MTRSVLDACFYLDIVSGYHPADPKSLPKSPLAFYPTISHYVDNPTPLRIAYSPYLGVLPVIQKDILQLLNDAVLVISKLGHQVERRDDIKLIKVGEMWGFAMVRGSFLLLHPCSRL